MKKFFVIIVACSVALLQACVMGTGTKTVATKPINKQRCSFNLPEDLALKQIDTTEFDKEGYFKIGSEDGNELLQIFVYDHASDPAEHLSNQEKAINSPDIFTAKTITPASHWGKYTGKGVVMNGTYNGGVIKGTVKIFAYSNNKNSFVVIRQDIGSHDAAKAEVDQVENSFALK